MSGSEVGGRLRAGRLRYLLTGCHFWAMTSFPPEVALVSIGRRAEACFAPFTPQPDGTFRVTILRRTSRPLAVNLSGSPRVWEIASATGAVVPSRSGAVAWGRISLRGGYGTAAIVAALIFSSAGLVLATSMVIAVVTGGLDLGSALPAFGIAAVFLSIIPTKILPLASAMNEAQAILEQALDAHLHVPPPPPPG